MCAFDGLYSLFFSCFSLIGFTGMVYSLSIKSYLITCFDLGIWSVERLQKLGTFDALYSYFFVGLVGLVLFVWFIAYTSNQSIVDDLF